MMMKCLYVCHVFAYFVGKIILAGGKIILAGGNIILAGWKIILAGLVTTRQSHLVRAREARKFLIPKKNQKRNFIHRFTNTEP